MSDYQPTEADVRTAMLNRGFTEAEVSELLNNIKAQAWNEGKAAVHDFQAHMNQAPGRNPPTNPYRKEVSDADDN